MNDLNAGVQTLVGGVQFFERTIDGAGGFYGESVVQRAESRGILGEPAPRLVPLCEGATLVFWVLSS